MGPPSDGGERPYRLTGRAKRERERERDASAMLKHLVTGPTGVTTIPGTYVETDLTRTPSPSSK
jgi:hypothetical protein